MAVTAEMLDFAASIKPEDCCLVPEKREELTTEGGLDVAARPQAIADACARLADAGVRVSLFIDPEPRQVEAAAKAGAPVIEIHTGAYADAPDRAARDQEFERVRLAVQAGVAAGLQVNAGHGLSYTNVEAIAAIPAIEELNIGHAIIARAIFTGLEAAVQEMKRLMRGSRGAAG
jgi:pyridoxine 5-phosphate synthase